MEEEYYKSTSKIWLIGDSNPSCKEKLQYPLNDNYFEYTGCRIADILIKNMVKLKEI